MNYFKGSGSCGMSASPDYKKIKNDMEKSVLNPNLLVQKNNINSAARITTKA